MTGHQVLWCGIGWVHKETLLFHHNSELLDSKKLTYVSGIIRDHSRSTPKQERPYGLPKLASWRTQKEISTQVMLGHITVCPLAAVRVNMISYYIQTAAYRAWIIQTAENMKIDRKGD